MKLGHFPCKRHTKTIQNKTMHKLTTSQVSCKDTHYRNWCKEENIMQPSWINKTRTWAILLHAHEGLMQSNSFPEPHGKGKLTLQT